MTDPWSGARYVAALEEFRAAVRRPFRYSSQASSAVTSAWCGVLGGTTAGLDGRWWILAVLVTGIAVSWTSWFLARRRGTLQPFVPVSLAGVMGRADRRELRPVLLGRASPDSDAQRDLVEAVLDQQRTSTTATTWPLIGMGLTFVGLALSTDSTWLVVLMVAVAVFVVVAAMVERVRNRRVERVIKRGD